jgi:hypothetical protein
MQKKFIYNLVLCLFFYASQVDNSYGWGRGDDTLSNDPKVILYRMDYNLKTVIEAVSTLANACKRKAKSAYLGSRVSIPCREYSSKDIADAIAEYYKSTKKNVNPYDGSQGIISGTSDNTIGATYIDSSNPNEVLIVSNPDKNGNGELHKLEIVTKIIKIK